MREIKFRFVFGVGDEVRFKLLSIDEALNCHFAQDEMAEQINEDLGVTDDEGAYEFELISKDQFTGLTDINGVEIYEGDIVSDHNGVGVVKYSDKRAAYRVVYGDGTAKWFMDYNLKGERESIKVIGNELQNPELLERS